MTAPETVDHPLEPASGERPADRRIEALRRLLADRPELSLVVVLLGLCIATQFVSEKGFFTGPQISTTLQIACPLGLIAAGQTLVMLTAGIDLSVANTATAAGFIMAQQGPQGTVRAIVAGLAVGMVIGLFNGIGVGIFRVNPLIMTLGTATIVLGGLTVYSQKFATGAPSVPNVVQTIGGGRVLSYVPNNLFVWVPVAILIVLGLRYSGFGRMLYAIGDNPRACRLAGVRVWQVQLAVYTACGLLSGLAGEILAGYLSNVDLTLAGTYLLPSVAAVVIGGTSIFGGVGGYVGTILGTLILTVLDGLLTLLSISEQMKMILYGAIILALAWSYSALARSR